MTADVIFPEDNALLLVEHFRNDEQYRRIVESVLEIISVELIGAAKELQKQYSLDTAYGGFLDMAGDRLGFRRPNTTTLASMQFFGFLGHDQSGGWDQHPMFTVDPNISGTSAGDLWYRKMLQVRMMALLSSGSIEGIESNARFLFDYYTLTTGTTAYDLVMRTMAMVSTKLVKHTWQICWGFLLVLGERCHRKSFSSSR